MNRRRADSATLDLLPAHGVGFVDACAEFGVNLDGYLKGPATPSQMNSPMARSIWVPGID